MNKLIVNDVSNLAEYMAEKSMNGLNVTAALFFNEATELVRSLMLLCDDVDIGYIELMESAYNGYVKEFYVTLTDELTIFVEPAFKYGRYLYPDSDIVIVDECSSYKLIKDIDEEKCEELFIRNKGVCRCDCCCEDCEGCSNAGRY